MKKLLVIQNNPEAEEAIDSILSNEDFDIFYSHNLKDGLEIAVRYLPNLILFFIDKDKDSMQVLLEITADETTSLIPLIIISDATDAEQMRTVMDMGADDYIPADMMGKSLLKSITKRLDKREKLQVCINNQINSFEGETSKRKREDHILVKIGNKLKLIKFADIVCITALKEYSKLTTKDNFKIVVRKSPKNWISVLPSKSFLQIHRATIINIDYIENIVKTNDRTYSVCLKNIPETFDISHRYKNIMSHSFLT